MKTPKRSVGWLLLIACLVVLIGCHRFIVPAGAPSSKIALKSFHGRYVIAQGEAQDWSLRQSPTLGEDACGWLTRYDLGKDASGNTRIALQTCYGRFVTAPRRGATRLDREVWQESGLGDCGKFTLERQGDRFALRTCAGTYLTAGDGNWEPPLQWAIIAEAQQVRDWEIFQLIGKQ